MKPISVVWVDAVTKDEWTDLDEAKELRGHVITTMGYLIYEDKEIIIVSASYDPESGQVCQTFVIPKGWIKSKRRINP